MSRPKARFRLSLKDHASGESLRIELVSIPNKTPFPFDPAAGRYRVRVNGKAATKLPEATLTEVFHRLRRWLVARRRR